MPGVVLALPTLLVLDTNVVIDWLVFADEFMKPLRDAVADGQATVLTSTPATDELRRVLAYPELKLAAGRQAAIFDRYLLQTSAASLPDGFSLANLLLPPAFPQCRDPDDQHFLALAWHSRATLASRDKAVLKLRKRAARFGVTIVDVQQLIEGLQRR